MSRFVQTIGAMLWLLAPLPLTAQPEQYEDIVVQGIRDPYGLTAKQLREAREAFESRRAELAPQALLGFEVFGFRTNPTLAGLRLRLVSDTGPAIALIPDENGIVMLPALAGVDDRYALQANRKRGSVRVRPVAISPGTNPTDIRMGDVRLTCRVNWAIARTTLSLFVRGAVGAVGGPCNSSKIAAYWSVDRPLASATVVDGARALPLDVGRTGNAYRAPAYDRSLSNEARLRLVYK